MKKVYLATTNILPKRGGSALVKRIEEDGNLHSVRTSNVLTEPKPSPTPGVYLIETRNSLYIVQLVM